MSKISLRFLPHELQFHFEAGTSRGVLTNKKSYFVEVSDGNRVGIGEAGPLFGLSPEFQDDCLPAFIESLSPFQGIESSSEAPSKGNSSSSTTEVPSNLGNP